MNPPASVPPQAGEVAKTVELSFPSMPEYLGVLRATVRSFCQKTSFNEETANQVTLAAVEAATNIIRHAYKGDPNQRVVLFCRETPSGIEIEFLDWGEPIPKEKFPMASLKGSLHPGGLGVHIMKTCMDQVEYKLIRSGGNRLLLTKHREEAVPAGAPENPVGEEKGEVS